eukprot:SM000089S23812  [mRNA]  locus=s89:172219:173992:- [translate_table: standard]
MAAGAPRLARQLRVSKAAFEAAVAENVEEFGMAPDEAARDAAAAFALQGVDLAGIWPAPNGAAAAASGDELGEATARLEAAVGQLVEAGERDGGGGGGSDAVSSLVAAVEALGSVVTNSNSFHVTPDCGRRAVRATIAACSKLHQLDKQSVLKASLQLLPPLLAAGDDVRDSFGSAGGVEVVVQCLHEAAPLAGTAAAAAAAAAAGSETNKDALMGASAHCMAAIACLCLRSPENAAKAVRLGVIEVAAEAMEAHPSNGPMQRQACNMYRNLAVRNPENRIAKRRPLILERGLEDLIRAAKRNHKQACKDAGAAALRDLGLNDYNA